jgi:hypothetical protein
MAKTPGLLLALLVVLAGCSGLPGVADVPEHTETETPAAADSDDPPTGEMVATLPDPPTDVTGWEDGYWHNETITVTNDDGMNASEIETAVARVKARVEVVRDVEFEGDTDVEVISREQFRTERDRNYTDTYRTFENTKGEALFLVGEDRDAVSVQEDNLGESVLGYYDPRNESIKLVSDTGQPTFDGEKTIAHELQHAVQDQRHNLSTVTWPTRDEMAGSKGLIEGEARVVEQRYLERCGEEWTCIPDPSQPPDPSGIHLGLYFVEIFPYVEGVDLVEHVEGQGGWAAVDAMFDDQPASAEQVIYPEKYTEPRDDPVAVSIEDDTDNGWERVRPDPLEDELARADYAVLGQSALSSMFAYTLLENTRQGGVVSRTELYRDGQFNFDYAATRGWEGDRLHVYTNDDAGTNETAYVWRLEWESTADAEEFRTTYEDLLQYYGATRTDENGTWTIPEGGNGFADAFSVEADGRTVTIVNAPTTADLSDVAPASE